MCIYCQQIGPLIVAAVDIWTGVPVLYAHLKCVQEKEDMIAEITGLPRIIVERKIAGA